MNVLIVESNPNLGGLWQRHMQRQGMEVRLEQGQPGAIKALQTHAYDIIVLNLVIERGSALAIADFASYRHPDTQIVFVTDTSFFSDGSVFQLSANTRAFVQSDTPPEDLTAMVEHYGARLPS
ncbi:response regulator [Roseovarius spongiae]|uniref:Response regulator n=1 Tax=Roseovarius spongiae TaxID=2320272 RepID=A0A3A8AT26_9RHOB|nr:response regulator transcription factor [Roseovarius spongiae]RKF14664.1 response regulator [Roseovarius spongiae]